MDHRAELRMARRHVRIGEKCIARQEAAIAKLKRAGSPVEQAEKLLSMFKWTQRLHLWGVQQVADELRSSAARVPTSPYKP
jgi:hypothetical protein